MAVPWGNSYSAVTTGGAGSSTGGVGGLIVIGATGIGLAVAATGRKVIISGILGTVEANGEWAATVVNDNVVSLNGSVYLNGYTGGGLAIIPLMFYAERGTLSEKPFRNTNMFAPDSGPPIETRRSSFATMYLNFNMYFNNADLEILKAYYRDSLGDGIKTFGPVAHPRTGVLTLFKFTDSVQNRDAGYNNNAVAMAIRTVLY